jgi:hypothetical protein
MMVLMTGYFWSIVRTTKEIKINRVGRETLVLTGCSSLLMGPSDSPSASSIVPSSQEWVEMCDGLVK